MEKGEGISIPIIRVSQWHGLSRPFHSIGNHSHTKSDYRQQHQKETDESVYNAPYTDCIYSAIAMNSNLLPSVLPISSVMFGFVHTKFAGKLGSYT